MRRARGALVPLEREILAAAGGMERVGLSEWHGYLMASRLSDDRGRRPLGFGTLYRALVGLEQFGLLESRWEDPVIAECAGRPRRRLYRLAAPRGVPA